MERLKCKACGSEAMVPVDVVVEADELEELLGRADTESRFFTCHVCGDNWLSVKAEPDNGDCQITFIHQMGMSPILKRVAHMQTPVLLQENTVDRWEYFLDDDPVAEEEWYTNLRKRRKTLKSICTN